MWPGMAPDKYWNNLDWLTYLYTESPMASKVVSCNSMGVGCCSAAANDKRVVTPQQQTKCWELGDAPSGGDRTTAGSVTGHFCEPDALHFLGCISPIFSSFPPVFFAFSPSRRGGFNEP